MNVTVVVAATLAPVMDGRRKLELGLPPSATVGDLMETLLKLYPRLAQHMANERKAGRPGFSLFLTEPGPNLREGNTVLLTTAPQKKEALA